MELSEVTKFFYYQRVNAKKSTLKNYQFILTRFWKLFREHRANFITTDNILTFLMKISEGAKQSTKKLRYSLLSAFSNFIKTSLEPSLQNSCDSPNPRKIFKQQKPIHWKILERDVVDEIIFRTKNPRNRLMLELMGAPISRGSDPYYGVHFYRDQSNELDSVRIAVQKQKYLQ